MAWLILRRPEKVIASTGQSMNAQAALEEDGRDTKEPEQNGSARMERLHVRSGTHQRMLLRWAQRIQHSPRPSGPCWTGDTAVLRRSLVLCKQG